MREHLLRSGRRRPFHDVAIARRAGKFAMAVLGSARAREICHAEGIPLTRAQGEGTNAAGGVVVPDEFYAAMEDAREQYGVVRKTAEIVPMGRDTLWIPRKTGAGFTATFASENTLFTESTPTADMINLTAKKLLAGGRSSTELADDADLFGQWVFGELAYVCAKKEDDCGFNGDGTSTYGGMTGLTQKFLDGNHNAGKVTATGHGTFATLTNGDLTALMAAVTAAALPGAAWFVSQYGFATTFCTLAATAGGIIMDDDDALPGAMVPTFLGFPVRLVQVLPQVGTSLTGKVMILFGDLSMAAALGDRRQVTLALSAERFMDTDQIALVGTERFDINVHDLGDNTNVGPMAALVGG